MTNANRNGKGSHFMPRGINQPLVTRDVWRRVEEPTSALCKVTCAHLWHRELLERAYWTRWVSGLTQVGHVYSLPYGEIATWYITVQCATAGLHWHATAT